MAGRAIRCRERDSRRAGAILDVAALDEVLYHFPSDCDHNNFSTFACI
jgi:hypothetical protein